VALVGGAFAEPGGTAGTATPREISDRDITRGWTWSLEPLPTASRDEGPSPPATEGAEVLAVDVRRAGGALVAGGFTGKVRIGDKVVGSANVSRGFIARVNADGSAALVKVLSGVAPVVTAVRGDRDSSILAATADRGIFRVDMSGREVWSLPHLPHPNAIALLTNRDLATGGCNRWKGPTPYPGARPADEIGDGYVARISAKGSLKWKFSFGEGTRFRSSRTCVTDVTEGPAGDLYVAGVFAEDITVGAQVLKTSSGYKFVARFSPEGRPRWARTLPLDPSSEPLAPGAALPAPEEAVRAISVEAPVRLAALRSGSVAVAGGIVKSKTVSVVGLALIDPDGNVDWLLPLVGTRRPDAVEDSVVVTSRADDVFLAGFFAGDLRVADKRLSQPAEASAGVFVARIGSRGGRAGRTTSLTRIPTTSGARTGIPPGLGAHPAGIAAGRGTIWLGGKIEGMAAAFVHRLSM
jgi:hypothetical protein